jgi:hypothetical protein
MELILYTIALIALILLLAFMVLLAEAVAEKHYLNWKETPFAMLGLYMIGVLPVMLFLIGIVNELLNYIETWNSGESL